MTLDEIVQQFSYPKQYQYPRGAVNEAIAKQIEITPVLLEYVKISPLELEKIYEQGENEDSQYFMWFFSICLLAQFKEKKAFPHIIKFCTYEDQELVGYLINDFITENLAGVLAATFDGDIEALFNIINNKNHNYLIRNSFLKATVILVLYGILDKDKMRPRYLSLLTTEESPDFIKFCIFTLLNLADPLLRSPIENIFTISGMESFFYSIKDIAEAYDRPVKKGDRFSSLDINTHEELQDWQWFYKDKTFQYIDETYKREIKKVGRNEPCSCGSGKKYKKCCLN